MDKKRDRVALGECFAVFRGHTCGISAPALAISHLLQQQTISNMMSQPATWQNKG